MKAKKRGTPILLARLSGVNGPMLALQEVDEFTRDNPAAAGILVDNTVQSGFTTVTVKPYIPNVTFHFDMFAHASTFANGQTSFTVNTSDAHSSIGEAGFQQVVDSDTGEVVGKFTYAIAVPPAEDSYCFNMQVDQHSNHGTWVSAQFGTNGGAYKFEVESTYVAINGTQKILKVKSLKKPVGGVDLKVSVESVSGGAGHQPTFTKKSFSFSDAEVVHDLEFSAGDTAGVFDVTWTSNDIMLNINVGTQRVTEGVITVVPLTSKTVRHAADGVTPDTRLTVGVCEEVEFTVLSGVVANWTADDGYPKTFRGNTFKWTAPETANPKVTITATIGVDVLKIEMNVIKPTSAAWMKAGSSNQDYPKGNAGCAMILRELTLKPDTVNFERILVQEVSGPPSNVKGYFDKNPPFTVNAPSARPPIISKGLLWHSPNETSELKNSKWLVIKNDNIAIATDTAQVRRPGFAPDFAGPFRAGSFTWVIPMHYRSVKNETEIGIEFTTIKQVFTMEEDGTMTLTKDDAAICNVTRKPTE